MSEWVSVDERLPKVGEDVLLTVIDYPRDEEDEDSYNEYKTVEGYLEDTPYLYDHEPRRWFIFNQRHISKEVIAWQPKPLPLEVEDE